MFEMSALKIDDDTFYISQFESFTEVCPPLARDVERGGGGDTGAVVNDVCLDMTGRCRVACTVTGLRRGQTERGAVLSWSILCHCQVGALAPLPMGADVAQGVHTKRSVA